MRTDTRRKVEVKLGENQSHEIFDWKYWNAVIDGVFYWTNIGLECSPYVISFNISTEVFDEIEGPDTDIESVVCDWQLFEIKEELALIIYYHNGYFGLWTMNKAMTWDDDS